MNDLRFALRQLLKNPGFTAVAVLTLALGIGACTAIFTLVNAVMLRELSFPQPDRLMAIWADNPGLKLGFDSLPPANAEVAAWREKSDSFERIAAFTPLTADLADGGDPERIGAVGVTAGFFETLGRQPLLGRTLTPGEEKPGAPPVVLIGHGLWQRRFGGDPAIIGRSVSVNGTARTVVGVLPPEFDFPRSAEWPSFFPFAARTELWLPLGYRAADDGTGASNWQSHDERGLGVIGRLKAGADLRQAQAEMNVFAAREAKDHPDSYRGWSLKLKPLQEQLTGKSRTALLILSAAAGVLLLIACVNVANLLLVRGGAREQEMAVRAALGAGRGRLIRQMLVECLLLSGGGGVVGLLLGGACVRLFLVLNPATYSRLNEASVDPVVLAFTAFIALLTCVVSGVMPALRTQGFDLRKTLQAGGRGGTGPALGRLRGGFVAIQVALALVLLTVAGLMVRSFLGVLAVRPGFQTHSVLAFDVQLPGSRYPQPADSVRFMEQLTVRLGALPGVRAAGAISYLPLGGGENMGGFEIEGEPPPASGLEQGTERRWVTPGYFAAMGVALRQGRVFTPEDRAGQPAVVVINETLARQHFKGGDPLGRRLKVSGGWRTVVGVVADVKSATLESEVRPQTYIPYAQDPRPPMTIVLPTDGDPLALAPAVRAELKAMDALLPAAKLRTMEQVVSAALGARRFSVALLGFFAGAALLLTVMGIYGVVAFLAGRREREIGIRMALGAQRSSVLGLILRQGMKPVVLGALLGGMGSLAASRLIAHQLYGVSAADPLTLGSIVGLLFAAAFVACWLPARRAARLEPVVALRGE